mmetsp:Transcript_21591/g.43560  ORF Transcript_21591/g.43560 Transcript_21591/m.43560 type:complete len:204 (+) Transcript_21591:93-704(+)
MYLKSVLDSIAKRRSYTAEDLYKLNEAVFNLPDGEFVNPKTTARLFGTLSNIMRAYNDGHSQAQDPNFFYDYVALLATMQNQHFLDDEQNRRICGWLYEALGHELGIPAAGGKGKGKDNSAAAQRELAKLEAENEALKKELEQLRGLSTAIAAFKAFKPLQAEKTAEPKAKAKAKVKNREDKKSKENKENEDEKDGESEKKEE